jgi:hypothetical protein
MTSVSHVYPSHARKELLISNVTKTHAWRTESSSQLPGLLSRAWTIRAQFSASLEIFSSLPAIHSIHSFNHFLHSFLSSFTTFSYQLTRHWLSLLSHTLHKNFIKMKFFTVFSALLVSGTALAAYVPHGHTGMTSHYLRKSLLTLHSCWSVSRLSWACQPRLRYASQGRWEIRRQRLSGKSLILKVCERC